MLLRADVRAVRQARLAGRDGDLHDRGRGDVAGVGDDQHPGPVQRQVGEEVTACHVRGASRVLDTVEGVTGIKPGETDLDLKYSLETVNCLGCCALGPVVEIDGKTHGKMGSAQTADVLKNYE